LRAFAHEPARRRRRRLARQADDEVTFDFVEPVVFALLSIGVIAGGAAVVLLNRITAAALLMAFTFLCMAGMFVLLGAETIAAFQVLIYVGAITVLILYGVMFTKFSDRPRALFFQRQTPLAAVLVAAVAIPVALFAFTFTSAPPGPGGSDLPALATSVFTDFAFPFEVASVLLLAAMVGAIALTRRDDPEEAAMRRRR
jgi:NADH:ubiquinone oxidoreductase subunit 6 (subunit J)